MSGADLEATAATLLAYVEASGAIDASAVVDGVIVEVDGSGVATVEAPGAVVPAPVDARAAEPLEIGVDVRALPPFEVDPATGSVSAPFGGLGHLADAVRALSRALGPGAVALVRFPTTDGETEFALSAREGEGLVVVLGDEQFEMDEGWSPG